MKHINFPANVGPLEILKPAGSMLRNLFGSDVPSDLLLLEYAQNMQITKTFWFIGGKLFNEIKHIK